MGWHQLVGFLSEELGLFCKKALFCQGLFEIQICEFMEPTNCCPPISMAAEIDLLI